MHWSSSNNQRTRCLKRFFFQSVLGGFIDASRIPEDKVPDQLMYLPIGQHHTFCFLFYSVLPVQPIRFFFFFVEKRTQYYTYQFKRQSYGRLFRAGGKFILRLQYNLFSFSILNLIKQMWNMEKVYSEVVLFRHIYFSDTLINTYECTGT